MRIALFTPVVSTSSIGGTSAVLEAELLNHGHEVSVIATEHVSDPSVSTHPFEADIVRWDESERVTALVQQADVVVYQIGDNYLFHRGCLEWLPKTAGVVCLHDYFVANLFWNWAEHNRPQAETILRAWYGEDIAQRFFTYANSTEFIANTHNDAPMTEWIASMATSVITHSNWGIQRVLKACSGPVEVVALIDRSREAAAIASAQAPAGRVRRVRFVDSPSSAQRDPFTVLTVGHMNPNKRQESVIRALGASKTLRNNVHYRLIGSIDPRYAQRLSALARRLGVRLTISGEVSDAELAKALTRASIMCCLRYPALESASGSTVEAMLSAKPTIVTDVGFYRELPDDCVCKISPDHEVEDLQQTLESLYADPERRHLLGANAFAWASSTFSVAKYAERLVQVSERAIKAAPAIEASRYFADVLTRWGASESLVSSSAVTSYLTPLGQPQRSPQHAPEQPNEHIDTPREGAVLSV